MTNEELVMEIKNGHPERIEELWLKVKRLITYWAYSWMRNGSESLCRLCDADDLIQSGYLALVKAVGYYHEDCGYRFTTGLGYIIRNEFVRAAFGTRTKSKQKAELDSVSANAPLPEGDPLIDLFPDPTAARAFDDVDQIISDELAHEVLEDVMSERLTKTQHKAMQAVFFNRITLTEYAEQRGVSHQDVSATVDEACYTLRADSRIRRLYKDYMGIDSREFDLVTEAYKGTGRADRTEQVATQLYYSNRRKDRKRKLMNYLGLDEEEWNELIG